MKKIKIFLGAFVNYQAAQNINCRSLSKYLDKDKFEVSTILYPYPNSTDFVEEEGVRYIKMNPHMRSLGWWAVVKGIIQCDVVYWVKHEYNTLAYVTAKLFRKKLFTTVEVILVESDIKKVKNGKRYLHSFRRVSPYLYAITQHIKEDVGRRHHFQFADTILYLGVETQKFLNAQNDLRDGKLRNICFIGNNLINKGIEDFFKMSKDFPLLQFHIIGTNALWNGIKLEDYLKEEGLFNIIYHGKLNHTELASLLCKMDLMYFPSRAEGFGKVTFEAACAGCPTLCYSDYGATEWINNGENGFVVDTYEEAKDVIAALCDNPAKLKAMSDKAIELGKSFDWAQLVGTWEDEIIRIYNS